ncbi:MAG: hypothetical protein COA41_10325 [Sphingopyxis sp.]|nr:MAG: hypothetical protein COA41_10325 [Sphingopyxis sp.]
MISQITLDNIEHLAIGSSFLGTGGGGDPYLGSLLCREAIAEHGPVDILPVGSLTDEDQVFIAAALGAPTVMIEKLFSIEDQHRAVDTLERFLGRKATAIISAEIGGCNSMMPVAYAAMRGLPIVDGDGMGRAFPELQMTSFNIEGVASAPMTIADEHGNSVVFQTTSGPKAEELARPVATAMGASVCMSCYPMTGEQARRAAIPNTLSGAVAIGEAIARHGSSTPPVERLVAVLRGHQYYSDAAVLFQGKITALERDTSKGWVFGSCTISALNGPGQAELKFQNENLVVHVDGKLRCVVPDLATVVDAETGHAIPTERLAYGQRVAVVGCSAPPMLRTARALEVVGPQCFGLAEEYVPIAQLIEDNI